MPRKNGSNLPRGRELFVAKLSEVKAVREKDDGPIKEVSGYASVFGNIDSYGDIVERGAFAKTIAERVPKGLVKFFDAHGWSGSSLLGTCVEAKEDDRGLWVRCSVSAAPSAQDIAVKMAEGHLDRMSFGFDTIRETFERVELEGGAYRVLRHLHELRLLEVSAAPMPVNEETELLSVKSYGVVSLPVAPLSAPWDETAARARIEAWAKKGGTVNTAKARRAFACFDPTKDLAAPEAYLYPLADIIDGQLQTVPAAVFAAAKALHGAKEKGPGAEVLREVLEARYEEIREATGKSYLRPPWEPTGALENWLAKRAAGGQDTGVERDTVRELLGELPEEDRKTLVGTTAGPASAPPTDPPKTDIEAESLELREKALGVRLKMRG